MAVSFVRMTDRRHRDDVLRMMHGLYGKVDPDEPVAREKFPETIDRLLTDPGRGAIVLFEQDDKVCGYSLLIPYWSNEFGGTLLFVDEIFVEAGARGRGIATAFFAWLDRERPFEAVALALEVAPANQRARALYEAVGFEPRRHNMMTRALR